MSKKAAIIKRSGGELATGSAGAAALEAWADATTDATSQRRADLLRDKGRVVSDFFSFTGKPPEKITAGDVIAWREDLERRGQAPATIYAATSKVSSFWKWASKIEGLAEVLPTNPVANGARPKAPKPYQSESTKSLGDGDLDALLAVVRAKAETGSIVGKRDYALLLHFVLTGRRRAEVIGLRWGDLKTNGTMLVTYHVKGGTIETREVREELVKTTMLDYLEASGRLEGMTSDSPIWTRHDRAGKPGGPLTSHAFAKNLKRYAAEAGLPSFHLHQLRHTAARLAGDESGSMGEVQEMLGHKSQATTRVYLDRIGVKRDRMSERLAERLGLT